MKNFLPRTDLALEIAENLTKDTDGIEILQEECKLSQTNVSWVKISNDAGSKKWASP